MASTVPVVAVDTSAVLAVLLREPSREALIAQTEGRSLVAAPSLPWEVGNALIVGLRRHKVTAKTVQVAWSSYGQIPVRLLQIDVPAALDLACSFGLYAYDAYVLVGSTRGTRPAAQARHRPGSGSPVHRPGCDGGTELQIVRCRWTRNVASSTSAR